MTAGTYDPGFDELECRGWAVREELVPTDEGQDLDGMVALRHRGDLLLEIYQGCDGRYELRGQGRGRPKAYKLVEMVWYQPCWRVRRRTDVGRWKDVASGSAGTVLQAATEVEAQARSLDRQSMGEPNVR